VGDFHLLFFASFLAHSPLYEPQFKFDALPTFKSSGVRQLSRPAANIFSSSLKFGERCQDIEVARALDEHNIPPPTGRGPWQASQVRRLLARLS
jgi:hypothetical protein